MSSNEVACETTINASQRLRRYSASCVWPLHWLALAGIGGTVERAMGIENIALVHIMASNHAVARLAERCV